jgi:hypothetical protein
MDMEVMDAVLHGALDYEHRRGWFNPINGERVGTFYSH